MSTTSQTKRMPSLGLRKPQRVDGGDAGGVPGAGVVLAGGDSRGQQPGSSNTIAASNSTGNTNVQNGTSNKDTEQRVLDSSTDMSVNDLKAALDATREEVTSYMRSVTGVLCVVFSVLTSKQIKDIENTANETMKDDDIFNKCLNQAKRSAAARDMSYKSALLKNASNEVKGHSPISSITTPQSIAHHATVRGSNAAAPNTTAQTPRTSAQNVGNQRNGGRSTNNEISNTSHITNPDDLD